MIQSIQRHTALALALALALAPSMFAENRTPRRTNLEQLAADMERVFGKGSVRIERSAPAAPPVLSGSTAERLVEAMNRQRAAHGLGPLRLEATLSEAAGDRVNDMLAKRYFAHVSPDGIDPFLWAGRRGYRYRMIAENLALGYRGTSVVDGWMRSPGHRENILTAGFTEVGIAIAEGSPRRGYKGPLVVAMYGRR